MLSREYQEAATETLEILSYLDKEAVEKIPPDLIIFLKEISSKTYKVMFNPSVSLEKLCLQEKTKEFLGYIYIEYICDENERIEYKKEVEALEKKYKVDNIFKNRIRNTNETDEKKENVTNNEIIKYKNNVFNKIINKIILLFKK